ncbi:MAG: SPFH domain-containing protein [Oscillospiraceae bacterium]
MIVHESQEAIFFLNGQALDLFGPGRYTLETENIPKIGKLLNRTTGDISPFHCEVYFINRAEQMSVKWGTDSKVQYIEAHLRLPTFHRCQRRDEAYGRRTAAGCW